MALTSGFVGALKRQSGRFTRRLVPGAVINRETIANHYIRGAGLEIGALHHPLRVPPGVTVKYVDRLPAEGLRRQYPELRSERLVPVDIVDDGERLGAISDASHDFVIANHFLEHCQNPVGALRNMLRVLKPGGILYLAIPDKCYTFDQARPVTPLEHVLKDFEEGPEWSRRQHFEEWVRLVKGIEEEPQFRECVRELMEIDYSIHYHVWTQAELLELVMTLTRKMGFGFEIELCTRGGIEVVTVLRKI